MEEHDGLSAVGEMTLPPSPKRPRTDYSEADNGKNRFNFPELLTFQKLSTIQQNASQTCFENVPTQNVNLQYQHNTSFNNIGTDLTIQGNTSKISITDVTETDRLILNMLYDSDGALIESRTSADTSSHDCSWLGKSLQREPPIGFSIPNGDVEDGRQVQNRVSQIQAVTLTSAEEDVRCQADCGYEEAPRDEGTDMQSRALAAAEESNQRKIQYEFSEKSLCNMEMEGVKNGLSFSHFTDGKSFSTKPGECPSSSLAEVGGNDSETLELQNVASCDGKTKEQFNEGRKISFAGAGECAVGTIAENSENKFNPREIVDGLYEAKKEQAVEVLITKVGRNMADDTTETRMSARISHVAAEGDNDAAPFSVIDPAIWSEADRPAEENRIAGLELSASEKVCQMEENLILDTKTLQCNIIKLSGPEQIGLLRFQSPEQQCKNENDCQLHTQTVTSITHDKTSDKNDIENHWRPRSPCSSSAIFHSAEDQRKGSQGTVAYELKEKDQSGGLSGSLDHPEAQGVERPQGDMARMDGTSEIKDAEVMTMKDKNGLRLEEIAKQQNIHKDTIERQLCHSGNEMSDCDTEVKEGKDYACNAVEVKICMETEVEVRACKKTEVVGKAKEMKIKGQETTAVASEHYKANMADIQHTAFNIFKPETHQMVESGGKVVEKVEEKISEQAQIVIASQQDKGNMADHHYTACNALIVDLNGIVESQVEEAEKTKKEEIEKLAIASPQHQANMANQLSSESIKSFSTTLNSFSEEDMVNRSWNLEVCAAKCKDHFSVTSSASSDAVVPGINNFGIHSQRTDHSSAAQHNCNGRFSPTPSAFFFTTRAPGGFDTFEKIQLSPDDNDMDASGLGKSPLLTSLPSQLLEKPQQQLYHSKSEPSSHKYEKESEEVEDNVKRNESHINENGLLSSDNTCNVVPCPVLAADVIAQGWPDKKPHCESAFQIYDCFQDDLNLDSSAVSIESDSSAGEGSDRSEFEMKKQFDMVLKELKLFFDISASDIASSNGASSPEPLREIIEALEGDASKCKDQDGSAEKPDNRETSLDDTDEDHSLECEGDTMGSCANSREGEQEVPLGSFEFQEAPKANELKDTEPSEMEQRRKMWSPSFMSLPLMEQLSHSFMKLDTVCIPPVWEINVRKMLLQFAELLGSQPSVCVYLLSTRKQCEELTWS